jgi:hypothetical protein
MPDEHVLSHAGDCCSSGTQLCAWQMQHHIRCAYVNSYTSCGECQPSKAPQWLPCDVDETNDLLALGKSLAATQATKYGTACLHHHMPYTAPTVHGYPQTSLMDMQPPPKLQDLMCNGPVAVRVLTVLDLKSITALRLTSTTVREKVNKARRLHRRHRPNPKSYRPVAA